MHHKHSHHKEHHHKKHHHGHGHDGMMGRESNPDRGPPMNEGEMRFDKGYVSDDEHFDPHTSYGTHQRGNNYMELQNRVVRDNDHKLMSNKFTKIP